MKRRLIVILLIVIMAGRTAETGVFRGIAYDEPWNVSATAEAATEVTVKSEKELIKTLYQTLLSRENEIVIKYSIKDYRIDLEDLINKIHAIDSKETAKDNDYLKLSLETWGYSGTIIGNKTTLNFVFTYKTTLKEEKAVDKKVKSVLEELELEEATDYEKVKAIHDYIINLVSYDNQLLKASAYNALIEQSAVCEGYSMLAYLMFAQVGLESRIVAGSGNGIPHSWNIVKVDDLWYNIDLTWDDPISSTGEPMLVYDYFLKSSKDFKGHRRYVEYTTKKFEKAYPITKTSYVME